MATQTGIEWTDSTWNPFQGCKKVSPGCKNCYMYRDKKRYGQDPSKVVRSSSVTFNAPLKKRDFGPLVFVCSWSDFFIEEADPWRDEAWEIIRKTPYTYQILTKRIENVPDRLPPDWGNGWPNVWLGVSVEDSDYYWRVEQLTDIPAALRFISYEPALGPISFAPWLASGEIHWVISGGESGYHPRPAELDWFRCIRDECKRHKVPYFHKQHGGSKRINGAWGGRELDGKIWSQIPTVKAMIPREVAPMLPGVMV